MPNLSISHSITQQIPIFLKKSTPVPHLSAAQIQSDSTGIRNLLNRFLQSEKETNNKIDNLIKHTEEHHEMNIVPDNTPNYFAYKNLLINQYLIALKFYKLFRLNGVSLAEGVGLDLYQKLFYLKTILVKLGPIDKKLQYQRDRLLSRAVKNKGAKAEKKQENLQEQQENKPDNYENQQISPEQVSEQSEQEDELIYRPNVKNLLKTEVPLKKKAKGSVHKSNEEEKYTAPKLSSTLPEDQKRKQKIDRQKQRRKAMLLRKFRGDIQENDNAEEVGLQSTLDNSYKKKYEEKMRFEEDNFVRLPESRKQKQWKKRMMKNQFKGNQLNDELREVELVRELVEDQVSKRNRHESGSARKEGMIGKKRRKID